MRGNIIPEPWASHHPFTFMLCGDHHILAHRNLDVRDRLRWIALERIGVNYDRTIWTPVQAVKDWLRTLSDTANDA
jgi:hypothetical protein